MTYYLDLVKEYLEAEGFTNIYIDYFEPETKEAIFLQSTGGIRTSSPVRERDFSVYIRRLSRKQARIDGESVISALHRKQYNNGSDVIQRITITSELQPFSVDPKTGSVQEFVFNARALVVDNTFNRIN